MLIKYFYIFSEYEYYIDLTCSKQTYLVLHGIGNSMKYSSYKDTLPPLLLRDVR